MVKVVELMVVGVVDVVDLVVAEELVVVRVVVVVDLVVVGMVVVSCIVVLLSTGSCVIRYAGHSGSSSEANRTTQVPLILSLAWWTGIVMISGDVIHCSIYSMTSLAVAGALS